jgi:hypothetical protein
MRQVTTTGTVRPPPESAMPPLLSREAPPGISRPPLRPRARCCSNTNTTATTSRGAGAVILLCYGELLGRLARAAAAAGCTRPES